ncbi:MAG: hypothetical protein U0797_00780 [Gemmataceae bacterium]
MGLKCTLRAAALALSLALCGCGKPPEEARQNRRLVDGVLTAVTTRNVKELDKCKALLDRRHADGHLPKADLDQVGAAVAKAKAGNWAEAEEALYRFREARPFPR